MKKIISLILVLALTVGISVTAFADTQSCSCEHTPVVYVPGFGEPIAKLNEDGTQEEIFSFTDDMITGMIDDIVFAVVGLAFGNSEIFTKTVENILSDLLGNLECTYGGDPIYNIVPADYDSPLVDTHKDFTSEATSLEREAAQYRFGYNWVEDPLTNAEKLNEYIENVKATTGHDKVVIKCHSEGNNVATAYLYKYGTESVEKLCYKAAAVNGIDMVGHLFTNNLDLTDKGDEMTSFIISLMQHEENGELISALIGVLNDIGLMDSVCNFLNDKILVPLLPDIYENIFSESFAVMPALWSFVPDKYYAKAKEVMLQGDEKYSVLVKRIDEYHNNVMNKSTEILTNAEKNGVDIVIISQYGFDAIPISANGECSMGDMLIETKYASFGATTAPIGETLKLDFNNENAKYYSKDLLVDASTCLFPDYTWFVRGNNHAQLNTAYQDLADWAILYDGQPTVFSDAAHPQFMYKVSSSEFAPVTEEIEKDSSNNFIRLIKAIVK